MYYPSFVTAVLMLSGMAPLIANAKGPQPKSDIVLEAQVNPVEWQSGALVGSFNVSGLLEDSGDVYYVDAVVESDGTIWNVYEFVGTSGSLQTTLPAFPDKNESYPFELLGTEGAYLDLYAAGTAEGRTSKKCHWVFGSLYHGRECIYTTSWALNAFVF
jgi:hypothetical protein